jgi:fibronectin type 3 domain-containing protein
MTLDAPLFNLYTLRRGRAAAVGTVLLLAVLMAGCDSNEDTTPPSAPSSLASLSEDAAISLSWTAPPEEDVAGYNIYRSTGDSVSVTGATPLNGSPVSETSFTDVDLMNGTTYSYQVTALDESDNESPGSNAVSATPFSSPPNRPSAQLP